MTYYGSTDTDGQTRALATPEGLVETYQGEMAWTTQRPLPLHFIRHLFLDIIMDKIIPEKLIPIKMVYFG